VISQYTSFRAFQMLLMFAALIVPACFARAGDDPAQGAAAPSQTPPAPQADVAPDFGAFTILGSTATGKTLFMKLPPNQTLEAAITQTADELGKVLDGKPSLTGAFAKAQAKNEGGASLTGKLKGKDIKGVIFCGTGANGGSATVVIDAPDASKDDIAALFGFIPKQLKMTTHTFPDGSGSIDLPDGWTTPTTSASNGIFAFGPAGQLVTFGVVTPINDPQCRTERMRKINYDMSVQLYQGSVRNYNQRVAMHQQYPNILPPGNPPTPPTPFEPDPNINSVKHNSPLRYCKYCDGPEELLKAYYPLMEDLGKRSGKPYTSLDKIIAIVPAPADPAHPNFKAGTVYIAVTDHDGDKATHVRALNSVSTTNIVDGEVWQFCMCVMRAPDETFDKDLPVMSAIQASIKLNNQVIGQEIAAQGEAVRAQGRASFAAMQRDHAAWQDQQARQFADHQQQIAAQQQAMHDSSSDFIEYIGGVRDVYDNQTGLMHSVDLFHSDSIVDGLNTAANDPNRFVQIPLRYER
jgi:hypothetical protein